MKQEIPSHLAREAFEVVAFLAEWWTEDSSPVYGSALYEVWDEGNMTMREAIQRLHEKTKEYRL